MKLTEEEIERLIEALEAWVNKDTSTDILMEMVAGMIPDKDGEGKRKRDEMKAQAVADKKLRKEQATLLAAKLIGMKDAAIAETAIAHGDVN